MPKSPKDEKNIFYKTREALGLTREKASELLETITPERLEKIENERCVPHADEVMLMAEKYHSPEICNYYCTHQCEIGKKYVHETKMEDLSQIVLKMLATLNSIQKSRERLIDITEDGVIQDDEIEDFVKIQKNLDKISSTVDSLKLWSEHMLADGAINMEKYKQYLSQQ